MKGWQHRWFMLDPESGMLEYFEVILKQDVKSCSNFNAFSLSFWNGFFHPWIWTCPLLQIGLPVKNHKKNGKRRYWWDGSLRDISSGSTLFVQGSILLCRAERVKTSNLSSLLYPPQPLYNAVAGIQCKNSLLMNIVEMLHNWELIWGTGTLLALILLCSVFLGNSIQSYL